MSSSNHSDQYVVVAFNAIRSNLQFRIEDTELGIIEMRVAFTSLEKWNHLHIIH